MGSYRFVAAIVILTACGKVTTGDDMADAPVIAHCDASFTISAGPVLNALVTFTATASDSGSFAWTFDAAATPASSTTAVATAAFMTTGPHTVMLTVTKSACTDTSMQTIMVDNAVHGTMSFGFTGANQTFAVPAGVGQVTIDATGAAGGAGIMPGGRGAEVVGTAQVTAGEMLVLVIGQTPPSAPTVGNPAGFAGGFNGGGRVGEFTGYPATGGQTEGLSGPGGGATDVRRGGSMLANRILVAAGGGGGGNTAGGDGGADEGMKGTDGGGNTVGGGGGTQAAGGVAAMCCTSYPNTSGALGIGGNAFRDASASGGGGGGFFGGGGGQFAGGGGGSSFIGTLTATTVTPGAHVGNGTIVLTW